VKAGRALWGPLGRLTLFAVIVVGATMFVLGTRGTEFGSVDQPVHATPSARAGASTADAGGYYILFNLARARAEAAEEAVLRTIIDAHDVSAEDRDKAGTELALIAERAREEAEIESVLAGQGLPESAVVISGTGAMVVVPARAMSAAVARRIGTDLWNLAGVSPEHVLIRPRA
jgi:hypothetical protein